MINQDAFRSGMRYLATGVNVVTTADAAGKRYGMTATAVCSVCAEPPTLLVCVNRKNSTLAPLRDAGVFVVNVLAMHDRGVADRFAGSIDPEEKFVAGDWCLGQTRAPVLRTALVSFECKIAQTLAMGTHEVIFGEIHAIHLSSAAHGPLLYGHGNYGALASVDIPEANILQMLRGDATESTRMPISVSSMLEREPEARADLDLAIAIGAIDPVTRNGEQFLEPIEAQIVSILGLARSSGTINDVGLQAQHYKIYVDAAEAVAKKEVSLVPAAIERLSLESTARHTHRGLETTNLLFNALHARALIRKLTDLIANRAGKLTEPRQQ